VAEKWHEGGRKVPTWDAAHAMKCARTSHASPPRFPSAAQMSAPHAPFGTGFRVQGSGYRVQGF
jgi:hypothetical protein